MWKNQIGNKLGKVLWRALKALFRSTKCLCEIVIGGAFCQDLSKECGIS